MKRVAITGMGAVTPIGNNIDDFWDSLISGRHGFDVISHFDVEGHKTTIGAQVKDYEYEDKREAKRMDLFTQYGITATKEALSMSGLVPGENIDPYRFNIIAGSGIGGIMTVESEILKGHDKGFSRVSALFIPKIIGNILAGYISINFGIKGSSYDIVTACASGTHAVGEAFRQIAGGYADAVICGAGEAPFAPACYAGFENMKAVSTSVDPNRASIPFDKERDGFIMGEGAGMIILEDLDHAINRGANILGEVVGYGSTTDAYHITSPSPGGEGDAAAMTQALKEAKIEPKQISYINAHGTSTPINDLYETQAIELAFGDDASGVAVSSTKSMTGHMLGAAGAVEAIACIKAINEGIIPPTVGYKVPDEELTLDYVPNTARKTEVNYAMSNSLGFGGHNAAIIIKKYEQ